MTDVDVGVPSELVGKEGLVGVEDGEVGIPDGLVGEDDVLDGLPD